MTIITNILIFEVYFYHSFKLYFMKKNVGSIDKIIRLIIAVVAIYVAYNGMVASPWNYVLYAVAAIMVGTALMGSCPLFSIFGIRSNKIKNQ